MRIVFPEGSSQKILKALIPLMDENICQPILLGSPTLIHKTIEELGLEQLKSLTIIDPTNHPNFLSYAQSLYEARARKGVQKAEAIRLMQDPNYFAAMMVKRRDADGLVTGATQNFADAVRPILQIIGVAKNHVAAGINLALIDDRFFILADTTINIDPDAQTLAQIAAQCSDILEYFGESPRVAMLSYS
ncbi:MAG: phosphate acyltransferase, partial [Bdellovibrionaceae bacterium]|nr:phosphate acyltransferase [Pseudobdellovibrionaceae bacterium]